MLRGKDPEYITENFDYVVKMFERDDEEHKELVVEQATKSSKIITEKVDTPVNSKIDESVSSDSTDGAVSEYLGAMKRQDRFIPTVK
jgi:hypothetical protein